MTINTNTNTLKIKRALEAVIDAAYIRVTDRNLEKINLINLIGGDALTEDYYISVGRSYKNKVHISFCKGDVDKDFECIFRVFEPYVDASRMACFKVMRYLRMNKLI